MSADRLLERIDELRAELQVRNNPERQALSRLRPSPKGYGWTELQYSDEAFRIWEGVLEQFPHDMRTVHHLAIMHHARAFDLEESDDPSASDTDWRKALDYWHRLWSDDGYWSSLASHVDEDLPNPFPETREMWPEKLLQIHFDIAGDSQSKHYRARHHVRIALESLFPQEIKDRVRTRSYERATGHLAAAVWEHTSFDAETLQPALDAISGYLALDDDFQQALCDMLDLLTRLQTGRVQIVNASLSSEEYELKLREMRSLNETYGFYMDRLGNDLDILSGEVISKLILWHSRVGQSMKLLESHEAAAEQYRKAMEAAQMDPLCEDQRQEMRDEWLTCSVLAAREQALGDKDGEARAREMLQRLADETEMPPMASLLKANAYVLLREFDEAEAECLRAEKTIAAQQNSYDWEKAEEANKLEPQCREMLETVRRRRKETAVREVLSEATEHMSRDRWDQALVSLRRALSIDPDCVPARIYHAQCMMRESELAEARTDLEWAKRCLREDEDDAAREAIDRLFLELEALQEAVDEYGSAEALDLRGQAVDAFNDGHPERAIELLRRAMRVADPGGQRKLQEEMRLCGRKLADEQLRPAADMAGRGDFVGARARCDQVLAEYPDSLPALFLRAQCLMAADGLTEAKADLARADTIARQENNREAMDAVTDLRKQIREMQQRLDEFGGSEGMRLRQQAVDAHNEGKLGVATQLLRQAIAQDRLGRGAKLKEELALCLDSAAVALTNMAIENAQTPGSGAVPILELRKIDAEFGAFSLSPTPLDVLGRALALVEEAHRLDPGNTKATDDVAQIRAVQLALMQSNAF